MNVNERKTKIETFEDLRIWQEAVLICKEVYENLKECRDYGFRDQIQRAAVSIPSNIAEGFERQTNKEFIQFLYIAKGSCGELRSHLYLANEFKYITNEHFTSLFPKIKQLSSMIYNFIKTRYPLPPSPFRLPQSYEQSE